VVRSAGFEPLGRRRAVPPTIVARFRGDDEIGLSELEIDGGDSIAYDYVRPRGADRSTFVFFNALTGDQGGWADVAALRRRMPRCESIELPDIGHLVPAEAPDRLTAALLTFAESL